MKTIFILLTLALVSVSERAQCSSDNIENMVDGNGRMVLADEYEKFVAEDLIESDYCQQGWGDEAEVLSQMRKACAQLKRKLLNEKWSNGFSLEKASYSAGEVTYRFNKILDLGKNASLSCTLILELTVDQHKQMSDHGLDMYCDH
jgi:hypothetical protein